MHAWPFCSTSTCPWPPLPPSTLLKDIVNPNDYLKLLPAVLKPICKHQPAACFSYREHAVSQHVAEPRLAVH